MECKYCNNEANIAINSNNTNIKICEQCHEKDIVLNQKQVEHARTVVHKKYRGGIRMTESSKTFIEKDLTKRLIKCHKQLIGKGPAEACVKVYDNIITLYCCDILTIFERTIVKIPGGEQKILEMRNSILEHWEPKFVADMEREYSLKVLDVSVSFNINENCLFGAILVEKIKSEK